MVVRNNPLVEKGNNTLDESTGQGNFEIGRILEPQIRNPKSPIVRDANQAVQSAISDFGFEVQDWSNFKISSRLHARFVKHVGTLKREGAALMIAFAGVFFMVQGPRPARIVSTTLVTDEVVAALVEPSRIVALSRYASDSTTSNVSDVAHRINRFVDRSAEQIIGLNPDMVLSTRYARIDLKNLFRSAGIPYHELTQFKTVKDIESNVRMLAKAVGEEKRGEDVIRDMQQKLESAGRRLRAERRSWRALYLAAGEWTAGTNTSVHEIFRYAGLRNAAAEAGVSGNVKISVERIVNINPDVIVIGTGYERDSAYSAYLSGDTRFRSIEAIRMGRIVAIPSRYIYTTSQFIGDGALELARQVEGLQR